MHANLVFSPSTQYEVNHSCMQRGRRRTYIIEQNSVLSIKEEDEILSCVWWPVLRDHRCKMHKRIEFRVPLPMGATWRLAPERRSGCFKFIRWRLFLAFAGNTVTAMQPRARNTATTATTAVTLTSTGVSRSRPLWLAGWSCWTAWSCWRVDG